MVKGNAFIEQSQCDITNVTEDMNSEHCKDNHRNLVLTPRTEASTPESGEYTTCSIDDSANIISTAKSSKDDSSDSFSYVERSLQRHLSQTDNHIQLLDRNGYLNEVAGSQSMLSQELIDHDQDQNANDSNGNNSRCDISSCLLRDLDFPEGSQSKTSIRIAKRLGLLTQTQEEEEEEAMESGERETINEDHRSVRWSQPAILTKDNAPIAQEELKLQANKHKHDVSKEISENNFEEHCAPLKGEKLAPSPNDSFFTHIQSEKEVEKAPLSGLELLTQVGIKEANKLSSYFMTTKSNVNSSGGGKDEDGDGEIFTAFNPASSRDNEGFGSLLNAVAKITEQEASEKLSMNWQSLPAKEASIITKSKKKRKIAPSLPSTGHGSSSKQRKSEMQKLKEKLRREKIEQENERAQAIAKKAAIIAERTITDPVIAKKLLLSMALARENPRSVPQALPVKGHVVQEGFFWAHYPPLELVLKKHMAEYYELSTHQCQSRQQQAFNNYMVDVVKDVAEAQQWEFADSFCDKSLRDRIRCYYKTHIQNAKKRLRTMVRNPTKRANARHLCEHVDLIEKHRVEETRTESKSIHLDQSKIGI